MLRATGSLVWKSILLFIDKDAPRSGAAIAFYIVTSFAPVLVIMTAIAGAVFGEEAARGAIVRELAGLLGQEGASLLEQAIISANHASEGVIATLLGVLTLILTASGVFVELQTSLNSLWGVTPATTTITGLVRARAASIGLVVALGFLLVVALVADAAVNGLSAWIAVYMPVAAFLIRVFSLGISFFVSAVLFAIVYRVLPDCKVRWHDVWWGAFITSALFQVGKVLIGVYLSHTGTASSLGAAGALIVLLFWVYYSAMVFLFGAAILHVWRERRADRNRARKKRHEDRVKHVTH